MKMSVGYMDDTYGTIEDTPDGHIKYGGNEKIMDMLFRGRIRRAEILGQNMHDFVASLPDSMSNFHWAIPVDDKEQQA